MLLWKKEIKIEVGKWTSLMANGQSLQDLTLGPCGRLQWGVLANEAQSWIYMGAVSAVNIHIDIQQIAANSRSPWQNNISEA